MGNIQEYILNLKQTVGTTNPETAPVVEGGPVIEGGAGVVDDQNNTLSSIASPV